MSFIYSDSEKLINKYFEEEEWEKARIVLIQELEHAPDNVWLLTRIGTTYYEERDYKHALKFAQKASKLNPNDPLVLWDLANALDMLNQKEKAIKLWKRIIDFGEERIGFIETGEGLDWAKSLICDCYYRVGLAYINLDEYEKAFESLYLHMDLRDEGVSSIYPVEDVKQKINMLNSKND